MNNIAIGNQSVKITSEGRYTVGEKEVTYRVTYVNGKEEARKKLSEKVLKEPVAEIVIKGTKPTRTVTSRQKVMDCDGSGHGYWIITYSDGTTEYQEF